MNIVFILVDDLGWSDLVCYGSDLHETPNIDRLAEQGMRFTDAYAASSVCTPSRAAIISGEHPARLHMTVWSEAAKNPPLDQKVIPPVTEENLALEKVTLAERLQEAGYRTIHIGKWHLGNARYYPQAQGFDISVGGTHWGCPTTFFYPYRGMMHGDFRYVPGLDPGREGDYLPDKLTDKAVQLIGELADEPFFLYMAYYTVHTPIEAPAEEVAYFDAKIKSGMKHQNATYAAMVKNMDRNVGRILHRLDEMDLFDKTIVILASDNGGFSIPWRHFPMITTNDPLRSGKGSLYEGGIRIPLIIRWPGLTKAGTVSQEPVVLTDLYPTLISAAGLPLADGANQVDGVNLQSHLQNVKTKIMREALYWHYPHYYPTTTPVSAVRAGKWKLLEFLEDNSLELYNLDSDPGESSNLAGSEKEISADLYSRLKDWRIRVNAQMPTKK